jgi:hypothetical protein
MSNFEMVPVAPLITGVTFAFTFNVRCTYVVRSSCFRIFSDSFFFIAFLSYDFFFIPASSVLRRCRGYCCT